MTSLSRDHGSSPAFSERNGGESVSASRRATPAADMPEEWNYAAFVMQRMRRAPVVKDARQVRTEPGEIPSRTVLNVRVFVLTSSGLSNLFEKVDRPFFTKAGGDRQLVIHPASSTSPPER